MSHHSTWQDDDDHKDNSVSNLRQLNNYVFPSIPTPGRQEHEDTAANAKHSSAIAATPNAARAYDEGASPMVVDTPTPPIAQKGKRPPAPAALVQWSPPLCLSVDELVRDGSPLGRRDQRVRFAVSEGDPAVQLEGNGNAATSAINTTVPYGTTAIPYGSNRITTNNNALGDVFDLSLIESASSEDEDETLEPYSVITKTDGVHIALFTQILALLQRTYRQHMRQIIALVAEVISPLLFVVLVIILNVAFGSEKIKQTNYASPVFFMHQIDALDYQTYLCYNDTTRPIRGLDPCSKLHQPYTCDGDESGLPVYGLCYIAYSSPMEVVERYLRSLLGTLIAIPTLDSIIVHQWMAKKAGLAASSRSRTALAALSNVGIGVSATTRYDSISYSGKLFFAPASKVPAELLTYIRGQSAMFDYVYGGTFDTVEEAVSVIKRTTGVQEALNSVWGLIIVNDIVDDFDVQIRLHGAALPTMKPPVSVEYRSGFFFDGTDMYLASGFLSLQKALYDYFYSTKASSGSLPKIADGTLSPYGTENIYMTAASFPAIESKSTYLLSFASSLVSFIVVLSFLYPFSQMTKRLVLEKELRIRELMCIMGLKRTSLWLNFLLVAFLEYLIICILLTILLCGVVVTRSDTFTVFLILLLYSVTLIPLSGLLSTFFGQARMAALMSPLVYFILSMPIFAMGSAGRSTAIGLSVFSPTGLATLLTNVLTAEAGGGFHAKDLHNPYFSAKPYIIMIMLACDVALYLLFMFYLDFALPQEWGTPKHPLFFITEPYAHWKQKRCAAAKQKSATSSRSNTSPPTQTRENARVLEHSCGVLRLSSANNPVVGRERLDTSLTSSGPTLSLANPFDPAASVDSFTGVTKSIGVRIDNLSKYFTRNGKKFAAVKNLSWNMYRGEIAVLLGPNGAGKSTTINMITGMLASNSGDCFIEGHSVTQETALARHEIGYCPQHNILWPDLTCREHLEFYGKIKGLRGADLENAVVDVLRAVNLEEKIDVIPTLMSGGQKRKLSVAIAFVGRNRAVLLDEPTAGMDPAARRHTWSLLRVMAEKHTIMITTHYMDEADLLGDNVAIVNDGILQCAGSTQFLRRYAGVGYTVRFDLSPIPTQTSNEERQAKLEEVWARLNEVVTRHLDANLVLQTDAELEYELQQEAEARIPDFLKEMESRGNRQLGIRGYALKAPTLEDVFMRVVEHQVPTRGASQQSISVLARKAGNGPALQATAASATLEDSTSTKKEEKRRPSDSANRVPCTAADDDEAAAVAVVTPANKHNSTASGSYFANPSLATSLLHRRMSRASRHFYNNEAYLNYGDDAVPSEESEDTNNISLFQTVAPFRSFTKNSNRSRHSFLRRASGPFGGTRDDNDNGNAADGGGEAEEPSMQTLSIVTDTADGTMSLSGLSPLASRKGGATTIAAAVASSVAQGSVNNTNDDTVSLAPTVAAKAQAAGRVKQVAAVACESRRNPAAPVDGTAVRNESFLYKHVTDRHLDQVWAARTTARRGSLWALQLRGMMYKRFYCAIRDRRMLFFQIICPVFCILLAMLLQLVKSLNNSTVYLSPNAFAERTSMPVSGCAQYYGPASQLSSIAADKYKVDITDPNFVSSSDMSNALLDTWHMHQYGRYVGLQCRDPRPQFYLRYAYPDSLGSRSVATILYNTSSHNSLPIALHAAYALAYYAGLGNASATFELSVTSLPENKQLSQTRDAIAGILIGVIVLIPFTFLPANPVAWVVKEYETRARHLQTVSGLHYLIYWAGNFLFDFTSYVVTIILVMIIFVIFQRSEYIGYAMIGPTIVSFAIYGICYCCMSYMLSLCFCEHTAAQLVVLGISFLTGFLCVMLVFVLSLLDKTLSASNTLRWVFRLLPPYSIGEVILNLALLEQKKLTDPSLTAWSMAITVWPDIYMAIEIPVFAAVTLLWDHPNRRAVVERLRSSCRACFRCSRGKKMRGQQNKEKVQDHKPDDAKDEHKGDANEESTAVSGSGCRRRASAKAFAAITPVAQHNARSATQGCNNISTSAASNEVANMASNTTIDHSEALLSAANSGARPISEDRPAAATASPNIRHRRASVADNEDTVEESAPEIVFVLPSSYDLASSAADQPLMSQQHTAGHGASGLPTVLYTADDSTARRPTSAAATFPQHTTSAAVGQTLPMSTLVPPPAEMVYPPRNWYVSDVICMKEEDSDVEEERNAVYREERIRQADCPDKKPRTPTTSPAKHQKGKKAHGGNVGQRTPEDHEPEFASMPEQTCADVIRMVDLRKVYNTPHKVAVSNLSFSVMHGEVFGFLGTNGAGKSSALSILTQERPPTSGRAYVCGHDVVRDSSAAANCLGYCPQFDAYLDLLTVEEHLNLYAFVRGVPSENVDALVSSLLTICNLTEYRHVLSSDLSGGNHRKLSVAIALIGAPKVVCLDEPTSGLDPLARRLLWRTLDRVSRKCSIILTTHYLEEVEALADCVGIMVDGNLRCFGDLPHLRHKYARNAYELTFCVSSTARRRAAERQQKERQQALEAVPVPVAAGRGGNVSANSVNANGSASFMRNRVGSVSYAGTDRIDTTNNIFQFMLRNFPSALLVDNFNNERFVYTLPATRDVAQAMLLLQNRQQNRSSRSFRCQSGTFGIYSASCTISNRPIVRLSDVFEKLRAVQDSLGITQYSVSQVSLEQVFLRISGTTEGTKKVRRKSLSSAANESMRGNASSSSYGSRVPQTQDHFSSLKQQLPQSQRPRRCSGSIFVDNSCYASAPPDAASPSRRRLSVSLMGGPTMRITFSEYRRQRALLRMRAEAEMPSSTSSETQRVMEPDHNDAS